MKKKIIIKIVGFKNVSDLDWGYAQFQVKSGVPDTEKQMKARGRRPSAFIVSRCIFERFSGHFFLKFS